MKEKKLSHRSKIESLTDLAVKYGTDKYGTHFYTQHYETHFRKLRRRKLNILEIGIGGYAHSDQGGSSLRMWRDYFPNSKIFGIDIYDKSFLDEERIKTFQGSQTDTDFLQKVCDEIGKIDIIVDDGSHINQDVITSFKFLFPRLADHGIYVIEDTQTSYWRKSFGTEWGGSNDFKSDATTMGYLKSLTDGLNYEEFTLAEYEPTYFDRHIVSMHFYHSLVFIYKGNNNEGSALLEHIRQHLNNLGKVKQHLDGLGNEIDRKEIDRNNQN
jgi:hypothetical protein